MRFFTFALLLFSNGALAQPDTHPSDVMGASEISCSAYLQLLPGSPERQNLNYWVNGRVVAIIPATVQPFLRDQSWTRFEKDLARTCERYGGEDLFVASALLAHEYKTEAEKPPK